MTVILGLSTFIRVTLARGEDAMGIISHILIQTVVMKQLIVVVSGMENGNITTIFKSPLHVPAVEKICLCHGLKMDLLLVIRVEVVDIKAQGAIRRERL
jgi:hypothetical protein